MFQIQLASHSLQVTPESVAQKYSVKEVFLEISQNSQESTCARVSFLIKFKKETLAQVFFCEFCEISKNILFYRTPPVAASVTHIILLEIYQPDVGITVI